MIGHYDGLSALESLMKLKLDRIISIATLVASLVAIILVLKRPAPVAQPQSPAAIAVNAQSFQQKMEQLEQAAQASPAIIAPLRAEILQHRHRIEPSAISRMLLRLLNPSSIEGGSSHQLRRNRCRLAKLDAGLGGELTPDSNIGSGAPTIKDQQVSFEGDTVHGQFLTEIAGKDVWVTVSGHLASKDGYATFEPTEFKVGDLNVPVSLVNPALQKKLAEQRDRLKLPDNVGDVKVENGELVMQQKR